MDFVIANEKGEEISFLRIPYDMDIDIGNTNDYVLNVSLSEWQSAGYKAGCRFFIPGTEYGGIIQNIQTEEGSDAMTVSGDIWRGMLAKKIIEPPDGQDYRKVSGEANAILKSLIDGQFGNLFKVSDVNSGITVKTYQFDRYTDMLTGIVKMLMTADARLHIRYVQGLPNGVGHVEVGAVRIKELNEEYSQDTKVSFSTKDVQNGINHLICLGKGELKDRQVVHLYADGKGNISQSKTFTGLSERTSTYDYSSAETLDDLIKGGTERLKELINYKQFDMTVDEAVADIGDIVGGREYTTGFLIKQQITQKILRASNDSWSVEFKVGGSIKTSKPIGGGGVDYGAQIDSVDAAVKALDKSNTEAHNALLEKDIKLQGQINQLGNNLKNEYMNMRIFSIDKGNSALNLRYDCGNLGIFPILVIFSNAMYFLEINGTKATTTLSQDGIYVYPICNPESKMISTVWMRTGESSDNPSLVRIKIVSKSTGFVGIVPLRVNQVKFHGAYQSN